VNGYDCECEDGAVDCEDCDCAGEADCACADCDCVDDGVVVAQGSAVLREGTNQIVVTLANAEFYATQTNSMWSIERIAGTANVGDILTAVRTAPDVVTITVEHNAFPPGTFLLSATDDAFSGNVTTFAEPLIINVAAPATAVGRIEAMRQSNIVRVVLTEGYFANPLVAGNWSWGETHPESAGQIPNDASGNATFADPIATPGAGHITRVSDTVVEISMNVDSGGEAWIVPATNAIRQTLVISDDAFIAGYSSFATPNAAGYGHRITAIAAVRAEATANAAIGSTTVEVTLTNEARFATPLNPANWNTTGLGVVVDATFPTNDTSRTTAIITVTNPVVEGFDFTITAGQAEFAGGFLPFLAVPVDTAAQGAASGTAHIRAGSRDIIVQLTGGAAFASPLNAAEWTVTGGLGSVAVINLDPTGTIATLTMVNEASPTGIYTVNASDSQFAGNWQAFSPALDVDVREEMTVSAWASGLATQTTVTVRLAEGNFVPGTYTTGWTVGTLAVTSAVVAAPFLNEATITLGEPLPAATALTVTAPAAAFEGTVTGFPEPVAVEVVTASVATTGTNSFPRSTGLEINLDEGMFVPQSSVVLNRWRLTGTDAAALGAITAVTIVHPTQAIITVTNPFAASITQLNLTICHSQFSGTFGGFTTPHGITLGSPTPATLPATGGLEAVFGTGYIMVTLATGTFARANSADWTITGTNATDTFGGGLITSATMVTNQQIRLTVSRPGGIAWSSEGFTLTPEADAFNPGFDPPATPPTFNVTPSTGLLTAGNAVAIAAAALPVAVTQDILGSDVSATNIVTIVNGLTEGNAPNFTVNADANGALRGALFTLVVGEFDVDMRGTGPNTLSGTPGVDVDGATPTQVIALRLALRNLGDLIFGGPTAWTPGT